MSIDSRVTQAAARVPRVTSRPDLPRPVNVIDFATSPYYLGVNLYPVQATVVKVATASVELLTAFDYKVISSWEQGWDLEDDRGHLRYIGTEGSPPGLLDRMGWCRAQGYRGLSELALVLGRRAGKGVMAAILVADLVYDLLASDGATRDVKPLKNKTLAVYVVGAKFEHAKRNAFADMKDLIENSPAFKPYLGRCTDSSVSLVTPSQIEGGAVARKTKGRIEIRAVETTPTAGRGPTMIGLVLDEFAHVGLGSSPGSNTSSIDIYRAIRPALAQFPRTSLILQTSSPWEKVGQLYESYQLAAEVNPDTGHAKVPWLAAVQLPSWATYEHWGEATTIESWPGGPCFHPHDGPQIGRDGLLDLLVELDPDSFRVEYGAQFAASVNPYLSPTILRRLTDPYGDTAITVNTHGAPAYTYAAHGDPARVGANFGFAIGHTVNDANGIPHVFIDDAFAWHPADFADHTINYTRVESDIKDILARYPINTLTFDQWNSASVIDRLNAFVANQQSMPRRTNIFERTATAPFNWRAAETFKTAVMLGIVHIPPALTEALAELEHLTVTGQRIDHPTRGPVQTKDIADSIINVVWTLIGDNAQALFDRLAAHPITAHPGLNPTHNPVPPSPAPRPQTEAEQLAERFSAAGRLGNPRFSHGAPRGYGYNPARGDRNRRGRHQ